MAISELGGTKIGCINGLANSLHFSQCFQDKAPVNPLCGRWCFGQEAAQFFNCPDMICDSSFHRGSAAQRATALHYFAYNFIKIHRTLRTSPAMAAGVTDRLWEVSDLVALWESYEQRRAERAA